MPCPGWHRRPVDTYLDLKDRGGLFTHCLEIKLANGTVLRQDAVPEKPSCESRFRRVWQQTLGMDYRMRVSVRGDGCRSRALPAFLYAVHTCDTYMNNFDVGANCALVEGRDCRQCTTTFARPQVLRLQPVQRPQRPRRRRRPVAQRDARALRRPGARLRVQVRLPGAVAAVKDR